MGPVPTAPMVNVRLDTVPPMSNDPQAAVGVVPSHTGLVLSSTAVSIGVAMVPAIFEFVPDERVMVAPDAAGTVAVRVRVAWKMTPIPLAPPRPAKWIVGFTTGWAKTTVSVPRPEQAVALSAQLLTSVVTVCDGVVEAIAGVYIPATTCLDAGVVAEPESVVNPVADQVCVSPDPVIVLTPPEKAALGASYAEAVLAPEKTSASAREPIRRDLPTVCDKVRMSPHGRWLPWLGADNGDARKTDANRAGEAVAGD